MVAIAKVTWGDIFFRMIPFMLKRWIRKWITFNKKVSLSYVQ